MTTINQFTNFFTYNHSRQVAIEDLKGSGVQFNENLLDHTNKNNDPLTKAIDSLAGEHWNKKKSLGASILSLIISVAIPILLKAGIITGKILFAGVTIGVPYVAIAVAAFFLLSSIYHAIKMGSSARYDEILTKASALIPVKTEHPPEITLPDENRAF